MKKHFFRSIIALSVTTLLVGNPLVAFCAYEEGDDYIDGIDELSASELEDIEDEALSEVDEDEIRSEIDVDDLYSQIDDDELLNSIDMDQLEAQIDEEELLTQIKDEDLEEELDRREAEEAEANGEGVKTAKVEIDPHPLDVTNIRYPTVEDVSPFDYILDPQQLIFATDAVLYGGGKVEEDATLLFRNREGDYDFSSKSEMLSVMNMGNVPVKFELVAELKYVSQVTVSDTDDLSGDECSMYLAVVDSEGNETPIGSDLKARVEVELDAAPDNAYAYKWNEEKGAFDYSLTDDPENIGFDSYSFGLVGRCNAEADWEDVTRCPKIEIKWNAESILTDWDAVNAKKAQEEAERKSLRDAKIDSLRDEKLAELKAAALEELVDEKLSELREEKKDELFDEEYDRLFKEEYLRIRKNKIENYISNKREWESDDDDDTYYDASGDESGGGSGDENSGSSGDENSGAGDSSDGGGDSSAGEASGDDGYSDEGNAASSEGESSEDSNTTDTNIEASGSDSDIVNSDAFYGEDAGDESYDSDDSGDDASTLDSSYEDSYNPDTYYEDVPSEDSDDAGFEG